MERKGRRDHDLMSEPLAQLELWPPERVKQLLEWIRSEERRARCSRRAAIRADKRQRKEADSPRYVDRVLAMSDDVEIIAWRGLRLLIVLNLCVVAASAILLLVFIPLAVPAFGLTRVTIVVGSAVSIVTGGGTIAWRVISRRLRKTTPTGDRL
jgi:hypothetical protein